MDYFLISLKPLLFTESSLCMNNATSGIFLKIHGCSETFPEKTAFLRVAWQCVLWKGLLSPENLPDLCLEKVEHCQHVLGNHSKVFSGEPWVLRRHLMGWLHWECLKDGTRRPRGWVSKSSILLLFLL